ncbi:MAG: hypothetical protein H6748_16050 [Spirochaetaceae bacterium]|nr:hypothetical protein [Spirochaetaceae bacterium]
MSDRIYLVSEDDKLRPMEATPYAREDVLQRLLEQYPDLLAGEQVDPENPRRWLLIKREAGITHDGDESFRWRLDHLFLDQDGVPTLVETKIATNPELRRQVVGQMLDYAANLVEYWSPERIQQEFEARCEEAGRPPDEVLSSHLGLNELNGADALEGFWTDVKTNLEAGRLRLVFAADRIPSSLLRIVEFLNGQMDPCEVIAVELRQYLHEADGASIRTLVPRVYGLTATAKFKKKVSRVVEDPGIYILEPLVSEMVDRYGLQIRRRMHRKGWLRIAESDADSRGEWLLYQNKKIGTLNISFDGGSGGITEERRDQIYAVMAEQSLPEGVTVEQGIDATGQPFVRAVIPGFVYDDDSNWGVLRSKLHAVMPAFLAAVHS